MFRFCLKYQRKTEFRKLCDKLRNHLDLVLKQSASPLTINLNNADTQQMNLDTRLVQLDAAIQMELWQGNILMKFLRNYIFALIYFDLTIFYYYLQRLTKPLKIFTDWWFYPKKFFNLKWWLIIIRSWLWCFGSAVISCSTQLPFSNISNWREKWRKIFPQRNWVSFLCF